MPNLSVNVAGTARILTILFLAISTSSCGLFRPRQTAIASHQQRQSLYDLDVWKLEGRVAVRANQESWQANLTWRHDKQQDRLHIFGPFGQGAVRVTVKKGFIVITRADGQTESSNDPEGMLSERLGFPVPLSALAFWVLGIPAPDGNHTSEFDESGRLRGLQQLDWNIGYQSYVDLGDRVLPSKLKVRKNRLVLKLVVDQWQTTLG